MENRLHQLEERIICFVEYVRCTNKSDKTIADLIGKSSKFKILYSI